MTGPTGAVDVSSDTEMWASDPDTWIASLPLRRRDKDIMVIVADDPLCGALLELAHVNQMDAFACETPLDVIDTLVDVGDRVACAIVSSNIAWSDGLAEFLADEYPHIERVLLARGAR